MGLVTLEFDLFDSGNPFNRSRGPLTSPCVLGTKLGADVALKTKLEAADYKIEDVVAIEGGVDGYTVYVDERA